MTLFNPIPGNDDIARILAMPSPVEPFVWGSGGAQITPEDLARRRAIADQQTMGDYSPVEHWAQGLGRVADGLIGGIETRRLDRQSAEMQARQKQILQSALGKDADLAPLLANKATASIVDNLLRQRNPKAATPTEVERLGALAGWSPDMIGQAAGKILENRGNPIISGVLGGNSYMGPQDWVMEQFARGGGPVSPGTGASVPTGSPLSGASNSKVIQGPKGPMQVWFVNGDWYDNPEGI